MSGRWRPRRASGSPSGGETGSGPSLVPPRLACQAGSDRAEHGRQLLWAGAVETMNPARRDFEEEGGFIEPGMVQDAVDRSVRYAPFEHGGTVGTDKHRRGGLEPGAQAGMV